MLVVFLPLLLHQQEWYGTNDVRLCRRGHSVRLIFLIFVVASSGICLVRQCAGTCVYIYGVLVIDSLLHFLWPKKVVSYIL